MLGTPEVPLVEGSVSPLPSRKGAPARPFLVLGLGRQGATAGTKWTESLSPERSLSPQGLCIPQFPVLYLARCHFFFVATAQAPSPPPSGQSLVKVPSASLCKNLPPPTYLCPRSPVHSAGLHRNPTPVLIVV